MPKFKVGDKLERVGEHVPASMREGIVLRVIPPSADLPDMFSRYEINFESTTGIFYETQLRLLKSAS